MKILMLTNGLFPEFTGGVEKLASELAGLLAEANEVVVYTAYKQGLPERECKDNVVIKRFKSGHDHGLRVPVGIRKLRMLTELSKERPRPDVILSMSLEHGVLCALARRFFRIPFASYTLGSDWPMARDSRFRGKFRRYGVTECAALIAQSSIVANDVLRHFPGTRTEVIPNGVNLHDKRANGDKIVYLGRLHPVKGLAYLIEAIRGIDDRPEVLVAGSGPQEDELKQMARDLNVTFLGRVDTVDEVFMQARVFVLPSVSEGLPQAMLEAMSFGVPVIATKVGGVPEVIEHGRTGFLVEPGDVAAIREHLQTLLNDGALRKQMSENCLEAIQDYSWVTIRERIEDVLDTIKIASHEVLN